MKSFTADQVPNELAAELIGLMQKDQCGDAHWKFHAGVSYRNLLIYRGRGKPAPFSEQTQTTPPHDVTDQPVADFLPTGPGSEELRRLMTRSEELFAGNAANLQRSQTEGRLATGIWLWGIGMVPQLPAFTERFGVHGAVITAVDLLRGLGRLLDWEVIGSPRGDGLPRHRLCRKGRRRRRRATARRRPDSSSTWKRRMKRPMKATPPRRSKPWNGSMRTSSAQSTSGCSRMPTTGSSFRQIIPRC